MTDNISLLLEIYCEEIPANAQRDAEFGYAEIMQSKMNESEIIFSKIEVFVGPRRITFYVTGIEPFINEKYTEIRGPKISAPQNAIDGFCKSNNISTDALHTKVIKDIEYYVYIKHTARQSVEYILPDIIKDVISQYVWPKSMFWGTHSTRYIRPIRNILCLLNNKILHFSYDNHLESNNKTFGHRFMHYSPIEVNSFQEYASALRNHMVILSRDERKRIISESIKNYESQNLILNHDEELLEEIAGLVEFPNILIGQIPERFMHIPQEILSVAMKLHQKYFTLRLPDGSFAPYFIFVSNIENIDSDEIVKGNEKVLCARLADAEYFYDQDRKISLESRREILQQIIFHAKVGNMLDKVDRIEAISRWISKDNEELYIAARLCKSDLTSEVVSEFPELQGVMGGYYAIIDGFTSNIANAIRDHYKPGRIDDEIPHGNAALLSLADKVDSLTSLYVAGERSSGSKDPYALRRYALGIIRVILENSIETNISDLVKYAVSLHKSSNDNDANEILSFIEDRLKHDLRKKYDHDMISSVIDISIENNISVAEQKLSAISSFLSCKGNMSLILCYKRVYNILHSNRLYDEAIKLKIDDSYLFHSKEERNLMSHIRSISSKMDMFINSRKFSDALICLESLIAPVDFFFDAISVIDEDDVSTKHRLKLLHLVTQEFHKVARFYYINTK